MAVLGIDNTAPFNRCDSDLLEKAKVKSLLHKAVDDGKATGIISTTRVTHATPAALYAHIQNRDWEADNDIPSQFRGQGCHDIAKQLVYSEIGKKVNLVFGGGRKKFLTQAEGGERSDENLVDAWKRIKEESGEEFDVLLTKKDLNRWTHTDFTLVLFGQSELQYVADREEESTEEPSLDLMTKEAIHRLKRNPKGFFLMVEGALIDYAHHKNWPKKAFEETLELEKAVSVALDLTDEKETLIVVTADHSHAMTINGYPDRGHSIFGKKKTQTSLDSWTPFIMIFIWFQGYTYNEPRELWNAQDDGSRAAWSTISYANGIGFWDHFTNDSSKPWRDIREMDFNDKDYRAPAMLPPADEYETHSGEDVPMLSNGPWSHLLTGVHEQTYITHAIEYAFGWSRISSFDSNGPGSGQQAVQGNGLSMIILLTLWTILYKTRA